MFLLPPSVGEWLPERHLARFVLEVSLRVIAVDVVQAPNDKQQLKPMLDKIDALPNAWARPKRCRRMPAVRRMSKLAGRRASNR